MVRWKSTLLAAALVLLCAPSADAAITFAEPAAEYPTPVSPWDVALGDLNEDTKPDIVVTSQDLGGGPAQPPGIVSVYLNKGDGTFEPKVDYTATGCKGAHGIAVGDFSGDGNLDVVTACGVGELATFRGNGDGTLQGVDFETGRGSGTYLTAAQLDGAGSDELVYTSNGFSPPTTLCRNSYSNGNWGSGNSICADPNDVNPDTAPGPLSRADFTGAGDAILSPNETSGVRSFRPAGAGDWSHEDRATGNTATFRVVATDLQADGDTDVIAAGTDAQNNGRLAVLLSDFKGGGLFGGIPADRQAAAYPSTYPAEAGSGDFDGDGLNDVMVLSSVDDNGDGSGDGYAYHGNTDGTLASSEAFKHPFNGSHLTLATGDLNGDGKADAVICGTAGTQAPSLHDVCAVEIATGSAPPADSGPVGERPPGNPGPPLVTLLDLTEITSGPSGLTPSIPTFTFVSPLLGPGATFECRFDNRDFRPCTSPHTAYNLSKGPHTFEVRALEGDGTPDPTPASRSFTLGGTTLNGRCAVQLDWDHPYTFRHCYVIDSVCPTGSFCTLTGRVDIVHEDTNVRWGASVYWDFVGSFDIDSPEIQSVRGPEKGSGTSCYEGAGSQGEGEGDDCPMLTSGARFGQGGPADVVCTNVASQSFYDKARRGDDDVRQVICTGTLKIEPAQALKTEPLTGLVAGVLLPSAGSLTVSGTTTGGARAAAKRRRPPAIKTTRIRATGPGSKTFKFKLTRAANKTYKRKKALKLALRLTFVASDGTRTVKTQKLTVKQPPPVPRRPRRP